MDVLIALLSEDAVLLFVDEVDSQLDGKQIFQRLIAPINGDPFFFLQKQVSFSKQNLVVFYALSSKMEDNEGAHKWPDFLSRIPAEHQIQLPSFASPIERMYRAVSMLPRGSLPIMKVEAAALLYVGLRDWTSSRELEQAIDLAKLRVGDTGAALELPHIAPSVEEVDWVAKQSGVDIYSAPDNILDIISK